MKKAFLLLLSALVVSSCVTTKKFNSMKAEALRLGGELELADLRLEDLSLRNEALLNQNRQLIADTLRYHLSNAELTKRYKKLLTDGSAEAQRMLKELESNQLSLNERAQRVAELEAMLKAREEAIHAIRRKVTDALIGFEGKGLSISIRDGNVYVSMEDKLLFQSGSFEIDPQGAEAIRGLGSVLAQNADINVMVEGHTDNVPYRSNGQLKDNLDLSTKRATTVVRLLLGNTGINPTRIIAAGRGEFLPVDPANTPEARAKNRRTEIILTPKLDELMQLMQNP